MRLRLVITVIGLVALVFAGWHSRPASADVPLDYDIPNGHFFTQTNGAPPGAEPTGFAVTNEADVPFWNEFRRLGGVATLGYPISRRFVWSGFTAQAFQKGVLQWRPEARQAWLVNTFDLLRDAGKDTWLQSFRSTPAPLPPDFDAGKPWATVLRDRQALLEANAAIKKQYFSASDPLTFFGLPASRVVDNGTHYVMRFQRTVIQQWKVDVPWAKAGQVTIANGGDIIKEAGLLPADVLVPDLPPWGVGRIIAIDAGHGGAEIGAAYRFSDGVTLAEKDLNLRVALKVAELLTRAGYKPVLTRTTDTEVNRPAKLLTKRPPIGLDDELQARIDIANNAGAKLFLSVHFNGHHDTRMRGPEVYYCPDRPFAAESRRFAELALANLSKELARIGYKDDGGAKVKHDSQALRPGEHFYLLGPATDIIVRPSQMPAILGEGLFVTNAADASSLRVEGTLDAIARAYAAAVHQYFAGNANAQLPQFLMPTPAPAPPAPASTPAPKAPAPTPTPTPTSRPASPAPKPAQAQGTIDTEVGIGAILRAQPATSGAAVRAAPDGAVLDILQAVNGEAVLAGDARWYRARYDGVEGYVYGPLVKMGANAQAPPVPAAIGKGTISTAFGGGAMLRAQPKASAEVLGAVANGAVIDLIQLVSGEAADGDDKRWYRARHEGVEGYVYAPLVSTEGTRQAPQPPPAIGKGVVTTVAGAGAMLRAQPDTSSAVMLAMSNGTVVDLIQLVNGEAADGGDKRWYRAGYDGAEGYIYAPLVQRQ